MSNIKEEMFQAAAGLFTDMEAIALTISNRDSLIVLTAYNEARKKAHRDYAEAINNKDSSWYDAKKTLSGELLNARWERAIKEEKVFSAYLQALDAAELAFDKAVKALDNFDAPMP